MWIRDIIQRLNRKRAQITFDPHLFDRVDYLDIELGKVEETVRTGKVFERKCEKPNKVCFKRYFGKENITYTIIVRYHENFIEVKTVWPKKGR